jgi:hypothetical protein
MCMRNEYWYRSCRGGGEIELNVNSVDCEFNSIQFNWPLNGLRRGRHAGNVE